MLAINLCFLLFLGISEAKVIKSAQQFPAPFSVDAVIARAADVHDVDPILIRSIIKAESGFDPYAQSSKGAIGFMQLMPDTARELGYDPKDKEQNILAGSKYLSTLVKKYKKFNNGLQRAIAAYNAGPGNVNRYKGIPPFKETRTYVKRVMQYHAEFSTNKRKYGTPTYTATASAQIQSAGM